MNMVKMSFKDLDRTLSGEEMQDLAAAEQMQPVFDADSPEMTADMLLQFKRMNQEERNKQTVHYGFRQYVFDKFTLYTIKIRLHSK